jgi:serine protease
MKKMAISCLKKSILAITLGSITLSSLAQETSDQLIIKYKNSEPSSYQVENKLRQANTVASQYGILLNYKRTMSQNAEIVKLDKKLSKKQLNSLIEGLVSSDSNIEYIEIDALMQANSVPNDSRYNEQWHYFESRGGINVENAWNTSTGNGINVAVLDTGIRPHFDLASNIIQGYDFINDTSISVDGDGRDSDPTDPGDGCNGRSSSWHGTHVAGTIAAASNNNAGVAGVAYNAKIVPVRVLGCGGGYLSDISDAIVWASGGSVPGTPTNSNVASVINLSLGGPGTCGNTFQNAINDALTRNSVVVVAAGNSNSDASQYQPASCSGVITVAATDRQGGKAAYSNYGSTIELAAPGGETAFINDPNGILSTLNNGATTPGQDSFGFYQGTSMAAPHVAGLVALMQSVQPLSTPLQIKDTLQQTARVFPNTCNQCGAGIINAAAAVTAIKNTLVPLYRYWNSDAGDHFYTIKRNDTGYRLFGYTAYEGIEGYVSSKPKSGFVPLYRYWNSTVKDHFYSLTRNDKGYAAFGYKFEKAEAYVSPRARSGYTALHSYWNSSIFDHFYTTKRNDSGYANYGYRHDNIEGYLKNSP